MKASEIPGSLMEILDRRAGKPHSRQGPVARCLAEILTEYEQMLNEDDQRSGGTIMNDNTGYAQDHAGNLAPGKAPQAYTAHQVFAVLKALGYGAGQADLAMSRAIARGSWPMSRHVVRYDGEAGRYEITPGRTS